MGKQAYIYNPIADTLIPLVSAKSKKQVDDISMVLGLDNDSSRVYEPKASQALIDDLYKSNNLLRKGIEALAEDITRGIELVYDDTSYKEMATVDEGEVEQERSKIEGQLEEDKILETIYKCEVDRHLYGYACIEVFGNKIGHVPSREVRKLNREGYTSYVQVYNGHRVYFADYNEDYNGQYIDHRTGYLTAHAEYAATKLLMISKYNPLDKVYGMPSYYSDDVIEYISLALLSVQAVSKTIESGNSRPYLVMVSGNMDDDTSGDLHQYIKTMVTERTTKNGVITLSGQTVEVDVVQLEKDSDITDVLGSDNVTQAVLSGLGLPQYRVLAISSTSGGLNSDTQSTEVKLYIDSLAKSAFLYSALVGSIYASLLGPSFTFSLSVLSNKEELDPSYVRDTRLALYDRGIITMSELRQLYATTDVLTGLSDIEDKYVDIFKGHYRDGVLIEPQGEVQNIEKIDVTSEKKKGWFK